MQESTASDPTTRYAELVLAGEIMAGPWVRLACQRHMDMLADDTGRFHFDVDAAQRLIDFFPDMLKVEEAGEEVPFYLLDWQVFCAGSINGWRDSVTGYRLFTEVYIEGAKGCGKSPFAAGIGLYMMLADDEPKAEVYSGASKKDQAMILFQDAVAMKQSSPTLNKRVIEIGKNPVWMLKHRKSGSFFRPLSGDKKKSGIRPHCGLIDELHEHKDRYTVDMFGHTKGRRQPLLFIITNSGSDRTSVCYEWHKNGRAVLQGDAIGDHQFFYIMALDPEDDPLEDESCWPKTNPGLNVTITEKYLRTQVLAARQIPGRENVVRRLNFCQWTDADIGWMTRDAWVSIEEDFGEFVKPSDGLFGGGFMAPDFAEAFAGADVSLGLDLAYVTDMAALAFCFPEGDQRLCWIEYFMPIGHTLEDLRRRESKDDKPYIQWIREGLIHAMPGPVIRKEFIGRRITEVQQQFNVRRVAFDRYAHKALEAEMVERGVFAPWVEHPQGFRRGGTLRYPDGMPIKDENGEDFKNPLWMPSSVFGLEGRVLEDKIRVQPSAVTRDQVANVVLREDPAGTGNRMFDKSKALSRIDGIVSLAMAVGAEDAIWPATDLSAFLNNPVIVR